MPAIRISIPLLIVMISLSWCVSCLQKGPPYDLGQHRTSPTDTIEPDIDTSFWLKPSRGIRAILEDNRGNLWLGGSDFVCMVEAASPGQSSSITYFEEENGWFSKGSSRILEDQDGVIWIQAGTSLYSYDSPTSPGPGDIHFSSQTLKPDGIKHTWASGADDLWFKKEKEPLSYPDELPGVYRYHDNTFSFLEFPVPPTDNAHQLFNWMTRVIKGRDGTTWFGTMEALIGFHNETGFTIISREEMGLQNDSRNIGIRAVFEDSKGHLWFGDNGSGVFIFDRETTVNFTRLHHLDKEQSDGPSLHRLFSIAEDDAGNMWFGTAYSGIWRYDPSDETFINFGKDDGVTSEVIWTIYQTKKGELLFGGEEPGAVYRFNPSAKKAGGKSFIRLY